MKIFFSAVRFVVGLCILSTILIQMFFLKESAIHYFSYFTILSNLLAGLLFLSFNLVPEKQKAFLRGFAVLCVMLTYLGFIFLLGGKNDALLPWVSIMLHSIAPLIVLGDWLLFPSPKITFRQTAIWLGILLCYLIYILLLGITTQWYAYDFLDIKSGIENVISYIGILLIMAFLLSYFLRKIPLLLQRFLPPSKKR